MSRSLALPAIQVRNGIRFGELDSCPSCGGVAVRVVLPEGRDFETGLGTFSVKECSTCNLQFTSPQPIADDLHLLYANRASSDFESSGFLVDQLRHFKNNRQLARLPVRLRASNGVILDYGCGSGFFTISMRRHFAGRVIGSDFDRTPPPLITRAGNIEYLADADLSALEGKLDLIVCRHVLEHSIHPRRFLERLHSLLGPGGILLIAVPNRRSIWTRLLGKYCFHYYLPRHLYHFDYESLTRQLTGFRILRRWLDHTPILGKSLGYFCGWKITGFALPGIVLHPVQVLLDLLFGRSTEIFIVAEKH